MVMKLHGVKHVLDVARAALSGSRFDDVDLSGCTIHDVNFAGARLDDVNCAGWHVAKANFSGLELENASLAGARLLNCRYDGMTIEGIEVTELLALWRATNAPDASEP